MTGVSILGRLVVGVVAVDHMSRHMLVQKPRHRLDTKKPPNKAGHHKESSVLVGPAGAF